MPSNQAGSGAGTTRANEQSKNSGETSNDSPRDVVADALGSAADGIRQVKDRIPEPLQGQVDQVASGLGETAAYVQEHDGSEMADDLWQVARDYPVPAALIATGIIVGVGYLIASSLRQQRQDPTLPANRPASILSSAAQVFGPQTAPMVLRVRDALVSLALARMVDAVEHRVPGFRQHFEKA